ncbi:MAG: hypothetical protein RJB11_3111, partial [Planctomycetota bacterium]
MGAPKGPMPSLPTADLAALLDHGNRCRS